MLVMLVEGKNNVSTLSNYKYVLNGKVHSRCCGLNYVSQKRYIEILTQAACQCDLIWKNGLQRPNPVTNYIILA